MSEIPFDIADTSDVDRIEDELRTFCLSSTDSDITNIAFFQNVIPHIEARQR